ncbi:ASCH domain-containing protein [Dolosigranulum pigrum]|uniref:ASCH domain-containing protein n=1 Tax=Dolosigranulum pigrum ATCC 51524 TaxID=883103 RepID=H3NED1_9LACT|nr:ASCH domain-containing protein [Dolosigranulum pigrum]EHR32796.1 hypothetical protein HMPREF9703_00912 [Dolosigranulum pigrum ATCC 51524]
MKTITLIQPWATLILQEDKKIETRSWNTNYRGKLAIHAGLKVDKTVFNDPFYQLLLENYSINDIPKGRIIAICELVDCIPTEKIRDTLSDKEIKLGNYSSGRFAWILRNVISIEPSIPTKGMLGLWTYKGSKALETKQQY